jgi:hypothetical protein
MIRSVDVMKLTQDAACAPLSDAAPEALIAAIAATGATHVAISLPYDDPACQLMLPVYTRWIETIRAHGMHVWFRGKPLAMEGFYDTPRVYDPMAQLETIRLFVLSHRDYFAAGDIFTPAPEPQNAGVVGINCQENCLFDSVEAFNMWLRQASEVSMQAFAEIGVTDIAVGYYGFDGFVGWGDRNPDWEGKSFIEPQTVDAMGGIIAVDHYFDLEADPQTEFAKIRGHIDRLFGPDVEICLSEWGAIHGESPERMRAILQAALDHGITCLNYWHAGPGGVGEALLQPDGTSADWKPTALYEVLREFYGGPVP